jgi:hypothetical protein
VSGHGGHGHLLSFHGGAWLARLPFGRALSGVSGRGRRVGGRASVTSAGPEHRWPACPVDQWPLGSVVAADCQATSGSVRWRRWSAEGRTDQAAAGCGRADADFRTPSRRPAGRVRQATALLEAPTEPSRRVRHASADRRAGRWRARVSDDLAGPGGRRGAGRSAAVGGQLALVGAAGPVGAGLAVGVAARWAAGPVGLQAGSPPGA